MAKGRKPLSVGMKQNKEDFDRELKTYSTKALKNIITIAENSFDANTRLKANMFLRKGSRKEFFPIRTKQ